MKYLNTYKNFSSLNEEVSKNDPMPEITNSNRLGIILLGSPGIGKSTFAKNFILNKNRNIKIFSTDDTSLTLTKDPNVYRKGASELNLRKLDIFMKGGGSFIYDTTGAQKHNIENITNNARESGYTIIYIHLLGTLDMAIRQNKQRDRNVPEDYLKAAYDAQFKNMKFFSDLNPDSYYIVYNIDGKYKFMKNEGGKMFKRKNDKYVPLLKESIDNEDFDIETMMLYLIDLVDAGYKLKFTDLEGNSKSLEQVKDGDFIMTKKSHSIIRNGFSVEISGKDINFDKLSEIFGVISVASEVMKPSGWFVKDIVTRKSSEGNEEVSFYSVSFSFGKEDEEVDDDVSLSDSLPIEKILKISKNGSIIVRESDVLYGDYYIDFSEYYIENAPNLSKKEFYEKIDKVSNGLGAIEWEFRNGTNTIRFFV